MAAIITVCKEVERYKCNGNKIELHILYRSGRNDRHLMREIEKNRKPAQAIDEEESNWNQTTQYQTE